MKRTSSPVGTNDAGRNLPIFAILISLLSGLGCGDGRPARVPVAGKVSVDGKLLSSGSIGFKPVEGGRMAGGMIEANGNYMISMYEKGDGLTPGKYSVSISAIEPMGETAQRWHAPKRYSDYSKSELVVEIEKSVTDLDFELTWEGDDHNAPWVERF